MKFGHPLVESGRRRRCRCSLGCKTRSPRGGRNVLQPFPAPPVAGLQYASTVIAAAGQARGNHCRRGAQHRLQQGSTQQTHGHHRRALGPRQDTTELSFATPECAVALGTAAAHQLPASHRARPAANEDDEDEVVLG